MTFPMLQIYTFMLVLCLLAGLPGAAQEQQQPETSTTADQPSAFQPADPTVATAPVDPASYKIGPEDVLMVRVWREPEVSANVTVRPDGKITLPLIGEIQAGGKTPDELGKLVTEKLSEFLNRPEVMVAVQQVRSKKYYISGQVNKTGAFPLVVPTTVLEALSQAGGFQQWAKKKKITIMRGSDRFKFNYNEVVKGKNLDQNIYLENGDHIIVP